MRPTLDRTKAILLAAFATLERHPRLLWFPVLSALGSFAIIIVLASASFVLESSGMQPSPHRERILGGLVMWYGITFVTTMSAVGLARATLDAMAGRAWTLQGALLHAWQRVRVVATFALVQTGVQRLLQITRSKRGRGMITRNSARVLDWTWWGTSYLAVPVLARENLDAFATIRRSAQLFRETWKEGFVGRLALGWLWLPFGLLIAIPIGLCALLEIEDHAILAIAIGVPLMLCGAGMFAARTLDTIYRTALYVFATEGIVPEPFDDPDLHEIWNAK